MHDAWMIFIGEPLIDVGFSYLQRILPDIFGFLSPNPEIRLADFSVRLADS
jgi:hypothetical protein